MDLIMANESYEDIGKVYPTGDFEYGDSTAKNNFELTGKDLKKGYALYVDGHECGGRIIEAVYKPRTKTVYRGFTWRGLFTKAIIKPDAGSEYKTVSGDLNTILGNMISASPLLAAVFEHKSGTCGKTVSDYQFPADITYLAGITDMCDANGCKLTIKASHSAYDRRMHLSCYIEPKTTVEGEYNEDTRLSMTFTDSDMGINHLYCKGPNGYFHLYLQSDGTIGNTKSCTGANEYEAFFDASHEENDVDARNKATEHFRELIAGKKLDIEKDYRQHQVGDIVKGRYRAEGLTVEESINKVIVRFYGYGDATVEYGLKEV